MDIKDGFVNIASKAQKPITSSVFDSTTQDDLDSTKEISIDGIRNLDNLISSVKFKTFMENIGKSKNK